MVQQPDGGTEERGIRVFISSTFRDMKEERDRLVKFVFPELRKLCEQRGVVWGEVDLRWGVSDEQAAEGKVLPICLEEIRRCRPYFIGLLGERYGWVPEALPPEIVQQEPWLGEHLEHSVTELEILHGVLRNPDMAEHAFFYFRDPAYVDTLPPEQRPDFISEDPGSAKKLEHLKDRVRRSGFPVRESYPDPKALGDLVREDLTAVINALFPEGSQPDPLDREAMDHDAYAQSRARVYIGRREYYDRLDAHAAADDDQPLVVLGESGGGKSALLANWGIRYRQEHPDIFVIQHYVGASPYSADWAAMLRRIMGEFKRRLGIEQEIPDQPDALRAAFPNWLHMAAAKSRVVLILDALNQLDDRDGAPDLVWLPPVMPANLRLVVSTLPGRSFDEVKKRAWPTMMVYSLGPQERKDLIRDCLAQSSKTLSPARVDRIAVAPPSANPLYLRVLLDELRVFGEHERLDERIDHYLEAQSPEELYRKVIARWDGDYSKGTPLVRDTLSLLWAARRGLTETELLHALGHDAQPLPRAEWSPLYLAMADALVSRAGLLTFAHEFLRTGACEACLPTDGDQVKSHQRLADFFEQQPSGLRRIDELPWQLAEAGAWQRLYDLLASREFFLKAWQRNHYDVKAYWMWVENATSLCKVDAYRPAIENVNGEPDKEYLWTLAILLHDTGHPEEALRLRSALAARFQQAGDLMNFQGCLAAQALTLYEFGDLDAAMALLRRAERICRQIGDLAGLQSALGRQALILAGRANLDGALALLKEQEQTCRQLGNMDGLAASLNDQANILLSRGEPEAAMFLHLDVTRICRSLGNLCGLQTSLNNQGLIHKMRGDFGSAMHLYEESARICRLLGDLNGLQASLVNQGGVLKEGGDLTEAIRRYGEAERICRHLKNKNGLQKSLIGQGAVLYSRGDIDVAMARFTEAELLCRELEDVVGLQASLNNQAIILQERGRTREAIDLHREIEQTLRQLGDLDGLQANLSNQGLLSMAQGDLDNALARFREVEAICVRLENKNGLQRNLGNQGVVWSSRGDVYKSMAFFREQERMCRQIGSQEGLAQSLLNQAGVFLKTGRASIAMPLAQEACRLAQNHGYPQILRESQAAIGQITQTQRFSLSRSLRRTAERILALVQRAVN